MKYMLFYYLLDKDYFNKINNSLKYHLMKYKYIYLIIYF